MKRQAVVFEPLHLERQPTSFPGPLEPTLQKFAPNLLRIDTSAACEEGANTVEEISNFWLRVHPEITQADIAIGYALGGVVLHEISHLLSPKAALLTISTPSRPTKNLKSIFSTIIEQTRSKGAESGFLLLKRFVNDRNPQSSRNLQPIDKVEKRIINGLNSLVGYNCDGRKKGRQHLSFTGQASRLACLADVCRCDSPTIINISRSGMCPHLDRAKEVARNIDYFLMEISA
ncbi:hypothetical protein [Rathayibacter toxicus]|uniref:hypothetical protein n=1 Tax=Rathayibacter toxicus TaxID=145458 RepID=UPI000B0382B0|nr:hypothetical protein [Rathayibacter toxicus]QOD08436.1 hypothetical protein AYW78_00650 [Rathayibacter toxicus]QWL25235.1 hypothetical protein E2R32_00645 [Rathayibacter toxicus]QWL48282.1 hypothetical protein E2R43_00615 [Rathayibacter toxicus]QWL50345.1 hypothetical protein E2R44_00645 [Rathayibacter toxicus]QWL52679.1 hypothetical protein E2R45_00615 [Rathayibacter toxicus]